MMGIQYVNANWQFDGERFSEAVARAVANYSVDDLAEMLDLSTSSIDNWAHGRYHKDAPYPHMINFLAVCNLLDLDPKLYFWVGEGER